MKKYMITRLLKKRILYQGNGWEVIGTRKNFHNREYIFYRSKKKYKKIWNKKFRKRGENDVYSPYNKYTNFWEYD